MNRPNIFKRFFEKRTQVSDLKNPEEWLYNALGIRKSLTGVNVNEITAIQLANQFCNLTRGNSHGTIYTVKSQNSYNPKEFIGEPLSFIANNTQLRGIIQFAS